MTSECEFNVRIVWKQSAAHGEHDEDDAADNEFSHETGSLPLCIASYSSNASSNAFASFKFPVSNPSVNQPYTGASRS
jgi:hypothetical protein